LIAQIEATYIPFFLVGINSDEKICIGTDVMILETFTPKKLAKNWRLSLKLLLFEKTPLFRRE
jgi:hypothetical protein